MSSGEFFGYIASGLVFVTFYVRTMLPLRLVAIGSNVAFITYALIDDLTPILVLHGALLPLNVLRLLELRELAAKVERAAADSFSPQAILPFMKKQVVRANQILFSIRDEADALYYIVEGEIFLPEIQETLGPGTFLGEFALFSSSGRRTATAIARSDGLVMVLSKKAVFAALLLHPQLGIHLLKLVTVRLLQNGGLREDHLVPVSDPPAKADAPLDRLMERLGRRGRIALIVALGAVPLGLAIYEPLYILLDRDAAVTTWLNVATAPIAGTVEDFKTSVGQKVDETAIVARIVNYSADRGDVIRAEGAVRRAEAKLTQLTQFNERVARLEKDWEDRRSRYADGFRQDLDLEIRDLEQRLTLQKERVEIADASARRRRSLRATGTASQADEDAATSSFRESQVTLTQMTMALERVRERRRLAGQGVFLQQDGKEPEWSWRSLDEIELEAARSQRAASDAQEEFATAQSVLADERRNFDRASHVPIRVPEGMTIWSSMVSGTSSVRQGDPLFSWIDCHKLLVDVPVTETLAALLQEGMRAAVLLDGDAASRPARVMLARGAASRLGHSDLASVSRGHKRATAQVVVAFVDPASVPGCPIGRRASVRFPDISVVQYLRAYVPGY